MSYDLTLFRIPEGADASLAYQQITEKEEREGIELDLWMKRPIPELARAEMRRIANVLKSWRPTLEEFRPASALPWIELNDDDLQVQFAVYDETVGVTLPYFRERALEMMECVTGCFGLLRIAADYSAYDPQLERIVTAADLNEMVSQYRAMDRALPGTLAQSRETFAAKKPWWKLW